MNVFKRIWARRNPVHLAIFGVALLLTIIGFGAAALGLEEAAIVGLLGFVVVAGYWWGGFMDLFDQ